MRRYSEKLLPIVLTLLLGLSPLQSVMAGLDASLNQGAEVAQMAGMQGAMDMKADGKGMDCEQCGHDNGCAGYDCSSGQCGFCAAAIPQNFFTSSTPSSTPHFGHVKDGFESRLTFSLFRPPKI